MKTAKEYIERMQSDRDFSAQIAAKAKAAKEAGTEDLFAVVSAAAAELDYEISPEQVKELAAAQSEDVSAEELSKIAGGRVTFYEVPNSILTETVFCHKLTLVLE